MYLYNQFGLFYCKSVNIQLNCYLAISSSRVFHPLFVTPCNPRSQSRLGCYRGNLCRIVLKYFTVYNIALLQHYGIKTYLKMK
jgi:hypothetical protein